MPAGFDEIHGMPMGLQLIGPPRGDRELIAVAAAYESLVPQLMAKTPPA
jgi:amidase